MNFMVQTSDLIKNSAGASGGEGRERLLKAATVLFADKGIDGVSTRELARQAGVNLSAITYHFGGKEGLYEAALQYVVDLLAPRRRQVIEALRDSVAAADGEVERLSEIAANFVRALIAAMTSPAFPMQPIRLLLRELLYPTSAFAIVIDGHINPVQDAITGLAAAATRTDADDDAAKLLGLAVTQQVFMLGLMRPLVLARLGWDEVTPARTETLINATIITVQRILQLPESKRKT
jgi:AcrR family transcriptional regulator